MAVVNVVNKRMSDQVNVNVYIGARLGSRSNSKLSILPSAVVGDIKLCAMHLFQAYQDK
jgi:hypothetical protein